MELSSMITTAASIGAAAGGGSVFGLVGAVIGSVIKYFTVGQRYNFEYRMKELDVLKGVTDGGE